MSITYSQLKTQLNDRFSYQRPIALFTIHQDGRQFNVFSINGLKELVFLPLQPKEDETLEDVLKASLVCHLKFIADGLGDDATNLGKIADFFQKRSTEAEECQRKFREKAELEEAEAKARYEAGFRPYTIYYEGGDGDSRFSWRDGEPERVEETIESLLVDIFGEDTELNYGWEMGQMMVYIKDFDEAKEEMFSAKFEEAIKPIPVSVWFTKGH